MKFKITFFKKGKHEDLVTGVDWNNIEEVYSCSDDHVLMKWNCASNEVIKVTTLPEAVYPTGIHWYPKSSQGKKQGADLLLLTSTDGKFHLVNKSGRFEKSMEAHEGAVLVGRWSHDGAGLLTAGEDGQIKIWSKSGMLRSTIVQCDTPIYTAVWGPDSNQVLYSQGRMLVVKPLAPNTKTCRWRAHDGVILTSDWNQSNNLIISGGEDCKYKIWDHAGRPLYSSAPSDFPVTCLKWSTDGSMFAVGAYNTLRLCDKIGWSYSLDKPDTGSIYHISWSADGTQIAGACGNGKVIFAHVIDRRLEWKNYEVVLTGRKNIVITDVMNDAKDKLDFADRVTKMELCYDHLVVTTTSQCHLFKTTNWNTPIIFDLKEGFISLLILNQRHFLLVERGNMNLYTYDGKLLSSPKIPGMNAETMDTHRVSLSPDTLAVVDQNDEKVVHLLDIGSTKQVTNLTPITHTMEVTVVSLSQFGSPQDRQLALLDKNHDLYVCYIRVSDYRRLSKLSVMIQSIAWNMDSNILAGVQDNTLNVWFYPAVLYIDKYLVRRTTLVKNLSEYGKSVSMVNFIGNHIRLRRIDGAIVSCLIPGHVAIVHNLVSQNRWHDSLMISRFVNDDILWACLACMSCYAKDLATAEEAYAAIGELDKVTYIQYIRELPLKATQTAYMALLAGNCKEAENILLMNGMIYRAILINLETHNWIRALELAVKHRTHVDTVLYERRKFLENFEKMETNEKYLQYQNEVELDPEKIKEKVKLEIAKEKERVK